MKQVKTNIYGALLAAGLASFGLPFAAWANEEEHHGHGDIELGSSALNGGQLLTEYNFERVLRTDFANQIGAVSLYGSTTPGIGAAEDEAPELYELQTGTTVEFAIVDIDAGLSIQIGATTLSAAGDSATLGTYDGVPGDDGALHAHPDYQIALDTNASTIGGFGEGQIDFVFEDANGTYQASDIYTFAVTNGYLAPVETATKTSAKCQQMVSKNVGKLIASTHKALAGCLDAVQSWRASGGDPETEAPSKRVSKACADPKKGIVAQTAASLQAATSKAVDKCVGTFGSDTAATEAALSPHMGMAVCRTQELIGATYSSALEDIAVIVFADDEAAAEAAFPCIRESQGSTAPEEG